VTAWLKGGARLSAKKCSRPTERGKLSYYLTKSPGISLQPGVSKQRAELNRKEQEAIAAIAKDDQENKVLIGSFLEASCREAFEMDDIRHVESTAIDRLETDSDDDGHRFIAEPKGKNDDLGTNKSLHLFNSI
jgi:hypothetical protein